MKHLAFHGSLLLVATLAPARAEPPTHIKLEQIPTMTMVEVRYSETKPSPGVPENASLPNAVIAKGKNSSIKSQSWPDSSTTFDVRINGWRFLNDPTARAKYRDYVQVLEMPQNETGQQDFPELSFVDANARVEEVKYQSKPAWEVTAASTPPRYTEEAISNLLKQIGDGPDRNEIEANLREAQQLEAKRASEPPNQVWVDPSTRLPIAAKIDGQLVTYTYKRLTELPQLPKPFQEAILVKFGKVPEF